MLLLLTIAGLIAGVVLTLASHVAPYIGAGNFIRDIDELRLFHKRITRREAHLIGVLIHLAVCSLFAFLFGVLVQGHIIPGISLLTLLGWSLVLWIFVGGIVLPLEGHGVFGVKEDPWIPIDLLVTDLFWAVLVWWILRIWPIAFPSFY